MFVKRGDCTSVADVVYRNTGIAPSEFLREQEEPYIKNLDEAVELTKKYLTDNPNGLVTVVGDYDSDGVNATAIMYWCLKKAKANVVTRIPHRISEGYGLSESIIDEIPNGLLITVDNGIAALGAIRKAKEKHLTVIVTDHHVPLVDENGEMLLPDADIIVDPHAEQESTFKNYCGAALAYRFACKMFHAKFAELLVLASIATVTDVMPLVGENHTLVRRGLKLINERRVVPGLQALLDELNMDTHISEDDYGFKIGPVLNAAGRLYDNGGDYVTRLLCASKKDFGKKGKAEALINANKKRKELVNQCLALVQDTIQERPIVYYNDKIPEGIVGLIAGRLSEEFYCPAIVFTNSREEGVLKGSGRSIPNVDLKKALDKIQTEMVKYGGHAGAAGVSIRADHLARFTDAFKNAVGEIPEKPNEIMYDLELDLDRLDDVGVELSSFAPFGEGNPPVMFHGTFQIPTGSYRQIGDGSHFLIKLKNLTLMGFGLVKQYEALGSPSRIEAIGHLSESWFRDQKSYQFEIVDLVSA